MPTTGPRRRADAERNVARIVAAARRCLGRDPDTSVDDIARAAGVGRMTLYGHFHSRAELVEAAVLDALRRTDEALAGVDGTGSARDALVRLLETSWSLLAESATLATAAERALPAGRVRELHARPAERVESLVRRGRADGEFRSDLPVSWLVGVVHYVLHGAVEEIRAGRMAPRDAGPTVVATVESILVGPAGDARA